jgi:hypothetical protein
MYWLLCLVLYKRSNRVNCCRGGCVVGTGCVCVFAAFRERVSHAYGHLGRNALYIQTRLLWQTAQTLFVCDHIIIYRRWLSKETSNMIALHNYFAQTLMIPPNASVDIVTDNAKGLPKTCACSERRRKYEAQFRNNSSSSSSRASRWESELPAVVTIAPQRRESETLPPSPVGSPKLPRRRTSVEEDPWCCNVPEDEGEETTSHSRSGINSNSSRSSRSSGSEGSADFALVPPQRRSSFFYYDVLEVNQSPSQDDQHPMMGKLQSRSLRNSPTDMVVRLDAQLAMRTDALLGKSSSKKKEAPRPPRRMKSMDPEDRSIGEGDGSLRLALSDSIHSVVDMVKIQPEHEERVAHHSLSSSEKLVLQDAIVGVVGALSSSRRSTTSKGRSNPSKVGV